MKNRKNPFEVFGEYQFEDLLYKVYGGKANVPTGVERHVYKSLQKQYEYYLNIKEETCDRTKENCCENYFDAGMNLQQVTDHVLYALHWTTRIHDSKLSEVQKDTLERCINSLDAYDLDTTIDVLVQFDKILNEVLPSTPDLGSN